MTFSYTTPDHYRRVPDLDLVGKKYRHYRTKKVYVITGYAWMGEKDVWGVIHVSEDGVLCVRSIENFFNRVFDFDYSEPRFVEVSNA